MDLIWQKPLDLGSRAKEKGGMLVRFCREVREEKREWNPVNIIGRGALTFPFKVGREGSPCCLTHITTQCLNASEQKGSAQTCCCHGIGAAREADKFLRPLFLTGLWALLQRMQEQEQQIALSATSKAHLQLSTQETACKDLSTSPAAEDSARPCWFCHLISFKNICHLDGVSLGLASIWKQLWSVWRIPFSSFWQKNMKNCSFLYVSESKWELYQNLTFLMEVIFSII